MRQQREIIRRMERGVEKSERHEIVGSVEHGGQIKSLEPRYADIAGRHAVGENIYCYTYYNADYRVYLIESRAQRREDEHRQREQMEDSEIYLRALEMHHWHNNSRHDGQRKRDA